MHVTLDDITASLDRQERSRRALTANALAHEDRRRADEVRIRQVVADHIARAALRDAAVTRGLACRPLAL